MSDYSYCVFYFPCAGPATVVCDYMSYVFMFLSVATSNMVATALAKQVILFVYFTLILMNIFV